MLSITNKEFNSIKVVVMGCLNYCKFILAISTTITNELVIHLGYCCGFRLTFKTEHDYFDMDQHIEAK